MIQALNDAHRIAMSADEDIVVFGEDIGYFGGVFRVTEGLQKQFGKTRVFDAPISEGGIVSTAVGMACYGLKPVIEIQFADYIYPGYDQIVSEVAKIRYRTAAEWTMPMVIRTPYGGGIFGGQTHSQSPESLFTHIAGLKVVIPSTPYDAKGLLKTAIRDENPVVYFEDKMMYQLKGSVPEGDYTIPFGVADIKRPGTDITFVATSSMVQVALAAAEMLENIDISAEVIDPRTMFPLDKQTLIESAKKTSRAIVVDEGYERYGVTAELAASIADGAFYYLDAPVKRMGAMDVPIPFSPVLEDLTVPTPETVTALAKTLCGRV